MADDAGHPFVHQLGCHRGGGFRVGRVIFALQFERDFLAAQREPGGVDFIQRQARTVFVVLAQMRLRTGERRSLADQHHLIVAILLRLVAASRNQRRYCYCHPT